MGDYWEDNGIEKPQAIVVCAACKSKNGAIILCGARHWDSVMRAQFVIVKEAYDYIIESYHFDQGFINQFGEFLNREEAMDIVKTNGQPFNIENNGGKDDILFSEGLY